MAGLDLVFLGLPHGASQAIVPELVGKVGHLVDLAADFRLQDASLYPQWYGEAHTAPELLPDFAYGLPELFRDEIKGAAHVATPGCYPTAAALALAPLVRAGRGGDRRGSSWTPRPGVSGAGRPAEGEHHVLRRRRGLHRLRPPRPPPHARDGAGPRRLRAVHARTWRR